MVTNYTPVEKNLQGGLMVYIKMDLAYRQDSWRRRWNKMIDYLDPTYGKNEMADIWERKRFRPTSGNRQRI